MKKVVSKLGLFMMVAAMCFCMTACGSSDNDDNKGDDKKTEANDDKKDDSKGTDTEDDKSSSLAQYADVEEYLNSSVAQAAIDSIKQSENEDMGIDVVAEGKDKIVYIFKYKTIAHEEGDGMTEALDEACAAQDATFQSAADSMAPFVQVDNVFVEIRYVDMNDVLIFSKTYTGTKK